MNKFYLSFSTIGCLTYILWGHVVSLVIDDLKIDSLEHRFIFILPFLILLLYHYLSKKLNIEYITYAGIYLITADYCYLIMVNNKTVHTTGLYVVLTASLAAINKRWFLWIYSVSFTLYCIFSILFLTKNLSEQTHWGNMLTLISLMTFFGLWRIKNIDQLEFEYRANIEKSKKLEELNNIAAQAAHDIRSPVMALESFVSSVSSIGSDKLKVISDTAKRINGIADCLVDEYRKRFTHVLEAGAKPNKDLFDRQTVLELIESLANEKLSLLSDFRKFKLIIHGKILYKISEPKLQFELNRIISNIINNSIDSFQDNSGVIDLILSENDIDFSIQIKNNGHGIPKHLITKVFEQGVTFNKPKGTGLGLYHAKEIIEKFHGKIDLSSKEGLGTLIQITIPKA